MEVTIANRMLELHQTGRLSVPIELVDGDLEAAMRTIHADARLEAPGHLPDLEPTTACWAAQRLVHAARFLLFRELEVSELQAFFKEAPPHAPAAELAWSADLALRFLPAILRRSQTQSEDDPLNLALLDLQQTWSLHNWPNDPLCAGLLADRAAVSIPPNPSERPWLVSVPIS